MTNFIRMSNSDKGDTSVRRHTKASSAGSTLSRGSVLGSLRRAFAIRGAFSDPKGSSAPDSPHLWVLMIASACLLVALIAAPGAEAGKAVIGTFGTPAGGEGGKLSAPTGVAVNHDGAGGVSPGDVYVADAGNNRISQFSATGAFIRSFGWNVVSSGPDNATPTSAVQSVSVPNTVTAGTFSLSYNGATTGGSGTGTLTEGSNAVTGLVTAKGTGNLSTGSFQVSGISTSIGKFVVGQPITGSGIPASTKVTGVSGTTLTLSAAATSQGVGVEITSTGPLPFTIGEAISGAGIPAGTTITATGPGTLTLSAAVEAGQSASGVPLTANLPYNATSATVQTALTALGTIGTGNATVTEGPGATAPYKVTFAGALANSPIPLISANSAGLTGGSVSISSITTGASNFEICQAGVDVCQAGEKSTQAGGLYEPRGLTVDQASGNLYVVERSDRLIGTETGAVRVDVYSAKGFFEGGVGWKVNAATPQERVQLCTNATGCLPGVTGAAAGQVSAPSARLVGPAVDPRNGHIYLPNKGNIKGGIPPTSDSKMMEFAPTLNGSNEVTDVSFVRAFGSDVTPTVSEKQTVTLTGATGGTFTLTFNGQTTKATGTGNIVSGSKEVTGLSTSTGTFTVGSAVLGEGISPGATITAANAGVLTLSVAATETKSVSLSSALPFNATTVAVQNALRALPGAGGAFSIFVAGSVGAWQVNFLGTLAGADQPQMTSNALALTPAPPTSSVTVVTNTDGANGAGTAFEVCTIITTCKSGIAGATFGTAEESPGSVAVDSSGTIYVAGRALKVLKFNASLSEQSEVAAGELGAATQSVAVDSSNDHLIATIKTAAGNTRFLEYNAAGSLVDSYPPGEGMKGTSNGFAAGTAERVYAVSASGAIQILGPPPAPTTTISPVTAAGSTSATFNGVVKPPTPGPEGGFATSYQFEYSINGFSWTKFPASEEVSVGDGTGVGSPNSCPTGNPPTCNVSQVVTGLQPNTTYAVRLTATTGTPTTSSTTSFTTSGAAPSISKTVAEQVAETTAKLTSYVNPNSQPTTYHIEWGADTSYGTRIPLDLEAFAGSGSQAVKVSSGISGLQPHTNYHFRVVAENAAGPTIGPDQQFVTLNSFGLPDNRAFELVSPADKRPQGYVGTLSGLTNQLDYQAASDGSGFAFSVFNGLEDSTAGGELRYRAARTDSGWQSSQVSAPSIVPGNNPSMVRYYAPDLRCAVIETQSPLTDDTPPAYAELGAKILYRWNSDGTYTLLTTTSPVALDTAGAFVKYTVAGASPDCSRIYFWSAHKLLSTTASGLYEWDDGILRDAGSLPNGAIVAGATSGGLYSANDAANGTSARAVSADGSRFFFTSVSNEGGDSGRRAVFVRKNGGTEVVDVSRPTTGMPGLGARYDTASPDGTHVFFLANYGIAATSSSGPTNVDCAASVSPLQNKACDLYDYDVDSGQLTDITATSDPANTNGAVAEGVIDVSEDGSYVYFAAMGQLVPGKGKTYAKNLQGSKSSNVYLWHEGALSYVTTLGEEGLVNPLGGTVPGAIRSGALIHFGDRWNAQATPDGRHLLFVSTANLTGYESGGVKEAYVYSADSGALSCVSCRSDGLPSVGSTRATPITSSATIGASPPTQSHYPRSISDDGSRIVFGSADALAPGAVQGKANVGNTKNIPENIYEWQNGQVYLLATVSSSDKFAQGYIESSATGDDIFIVTNEQLVPEDIDFVPDVYDLRANGGFPEPVPPAEPCDPAQDQCQGPASPPPSPAAPASAGFVGPGNPSVQSSTPHKKNRHKKKHKKERRPHKKRAAKATHSRAANHNFGGAK